MSDELLDAGGFSKKYGIQLPDMASLLTEARCDEYPPIAAGFWPRYSVEDAEGHFRQLALRRGLDRPAAALEMGLTPPSFDVISEEILFSASGKYLLEFLVAYRRRKLPKNKIWGSRTCLVENLIEVLKSDHPGVKIEMQKCEVPGCDDAAIDECSGYKCRDSRNGRRMFLCPSHARPDPGAKFSPDYPKVFCPICRQDD